jgi:hypothetical protein
MSWPSPFTSATFADGEQIDNTKLYTRVLSWLNDLSAFTGDDTGWVTTGVTPLNSSTIGTCRMRKCGHVIEVFLTITLGTTITVPSDGNITNSTVATVPAAFWPGTANGPLASGNGGPLVSGAVDPAGVVSLYATVPGASLASGVTITLAGAFLD